MERKIGEIFEYNGGWYQAVERTEKSCKACYFYSDEGCFVSTGLGRCRHYSRNDNKSVIFKRLEKYGGFIKDNIRGEICQPYTIFDIDRANSRDDRVQFSDSKNDFVFVVTKQNQEDMEEKKLNLKPFDIQKAREGKPVCTRDGRKARIICFDRRLFYKNVSYPILAVVERSDGEDDVCGYNEKGKVLIEDGAEYKDDLMMLPEKKEGWVNVYYDNDASSHRGCRYIYDTKEQAIKDAGSAYITTVKINWSE